MGFKPSISPSRTLQLRQTYIGISRYIRGRTSHHLFPCTNATTVPLRHSSTPAKRATISATTRSGYHVSAASVSESDPVLNAHKKNFTTHSQELSIAQYQSLVNFERTSIHTATPLTAWEDLKEVVANDLGLGQNHHTVKICGYITSQRPCKGFSFLQLVDPSLKYSVQLIVHDEKNTVESSTSDTESEVHVSAESGKDQIRNIRPHTPVQVHGVLVPRQPPGLKNGSKKRDKANNNGELHGASPETPQTVPTHDPFVGHVELFARFEIKAEAVKPLNTFPPELVAQFDTAFPPEGRHLQFRTDQALRQRIQLRTHVATRVRNDLVAAGFQEIETPVLFKSTPEGAREFLVPTRKKGLAYALPQSPQQYKQLLMASGIPQYFQFAKCFRDEDLRADRQPEFTQLDLEMSFADSHVVMATVRTLLEKSILPASLPTLDAEEPFQVLTYDDAMKLYGSDKPDTRLGSVIQRIDNWLPSNVVGMMTSLENPAIEMLKIDMQGSSPSQSDIFIRGFMDAPSSTAYTTNASGMPGIAIYDSSKPMSGLSSFGYEGASRIEEHFQPEQGDIIIAQARPNKRLTGGSTILGGLRREIYAAAIAQGLMYPPKGFAKLWIIDFPLFSPIEDSSPGQGGSAGICSTHHPFTAPKPGQDLSKLITDPLDVIGDHYDLVINGVEVGGGSRRIHTSDMQELIFRDVLKMKPERIEDFRHLLDALSCGCPPHAGFALGFDRLMAILTGTDSVRDVIAFPKTADGEDKFVGSPTPINKEQLKTYHLRIEEELPVQL